MCSNFILLHCSCAVFPVPLIEEAVFSALYILASFVKKRVPIDMWVYLWAFYLILVIYISVFVLVASHLDDCSFVIFEVRKVDSSSYIFLSQDCFDYSGSFMFPYKL